MTRKQILKNMSNSPMMQSIQEHSLEQLLTIRQQFQQKILERKATTWRSFGFAFLCTLLICSVIVLVAEATLPQFILTHLIGQAAGFFIWYYVDGSRFHALYMMEKTLTTLLDAAILEKQQAV